MISKVVATTSRVGCAAAVGGSGLTILEFMACTIAVIGGAWLGALYLGVDVRHLAFTALSQSQVAGQGAGRIAAGRS